MWCVLLSCSAAVSNSIYWLLRHFCDHRKVQRLNLLFQGLCFFMMNAYWTCPYRAQCITTWLWSFVFLTFFLHWQTNNRRVLKEAKPIDSDAKLGVWIGRWSRIKMKHLKETWLCALDVIGGNGSVIASIPSWSLKSMKCVAVGSDSSWKLKATNVRESYIYSDLWLQKRWHNKFCLITQANILRY